MKPRHGDTPPRACRLERAPKVVELIGRWEEAGASHVSVNTMGASFEVEAHLEALAATADALHLTVP